MNFKVKKEKYIATIDNGHSCAAQATSMLTKEVLSLFISANDICICFFFVEKAKNHSQARRKQYIKDTLKKKDKKYSAKFNKHKLHKT